MTMTRQFSTNAWKTAPFSSRWTQAMYRQEDPKPPIQSSVLSASLRKTLRFLMTERYLISKTEAPRLAFVIGHWAASRIGSKRSQGHGYDCGSYGLGGFLCVYMKNREDNKQCHLPSEGGGGALFSLYSLFLFSPFSLSPFSPFPLFLPFFPFFLVHFLLGLALFKVSFSPLVACSLSLSLSFASFLSLSVACRH